MTTPNRKLIFAALCAACSLAACMLASPALAQGSEHKASDHDFAASDSAVACDQETLSIGIPTTIGNLDPAYTIESDTVGIISNIYDNLLRLSDNLTDLEPALATDYEVSEDGLTYTFHLRRGVRFHDGTEFNAQAVRFNYDRLMPGRAAEDMPFSDEVFEPIESIETPDPHTVVFHLKHPSTDFLYNTARITAVSIVSPSAVRKHHNNVKYHPVGTGPYRFVSRKGGLELRLVRNEHYFGKVPAVKNVRVFSVPDQLKRLSLLLDGRLDIISGVTPKMLEGLEGTDNRMSFTRALNTGYIAFNFRPSSNVLDAEVRHAIGAALNMRHALRQVYGEHAVAAESFMPDGHDHDSSVSFTSYDPKNAAEVLKRRNIKSLRIIASEESRFFNTTNGSVIAEDLMEQLKKAGISSTLVVYPKSDFTSMLQFGDWDLCIDGWHSETGRAMHMLRPLIAEDPLLNTGAWHNDEFLELVEKASAVTDESERDAAFAEVEKLLARELPVIPLSHAKKHLRLRKEDQRHLCA